MSHSGCCGVMMRRRLAAMAAVFTPRRRCRDVIWSWRAVVKIVDSTVIA